MCFYPSTCFTSGSHFLGYTRNSSYFTATGSALQRSQPQTTVLSQINPMHSLPSSFFKLPPKPRSSKWFLYSGFHPKTLCAFLLSLTSQLPPSVRYVAGHSGRAVYSPSPAEIVGSNPNGSMEVCPL